MPDNVIAIIGAGMIGAAHAAAYRQFAHLFGEGRARLKTVCDANADLARALARRHGFETTSFQLGGGGERPRH